MKLGIPSLIVMLILTMSLGCGTDPKKTEVPQSIDDRQEDAKLKAAVEKLTEEEQKLFAAYALRMAMGEAFGQKGVAGSITIGEAIERERAWQEEQAREEAKRKELAAKLEKERLEALGKLNDALAVSVISLSFRNSDFNEGRYSDDFVIKIGFENHTDKDLMGVKGVVIFKDIFGDIIKKVGLSNDDIKAHKTHVWVGTLGYNQFMDQDNKLRTTSFDKLKIEWEPEVYIFADGSQMRMPLGDN